MRPKNLQFPVLRILGWFWLSSQFLACATSVQLKTTPTAKVFKLKPDFSEQASLGTAPLTLPRDENILRLRLESDDSMDQYLVLMFPDQAKGDINLALGGVTQQKSVADAYRDYFNLLLRAHRKLLTGQLNECKEVLRRLDQEYEETYGSAILRGTVAMLEGRISEGSGILNYARSMYPESGDLDWLKEQGSPSGGAKK